MDGTFQLIHHRTGLCSLLDRELGVLQRFDGSRLSGVEDVGDLGVIQLAGLWQQSRSSAEPTAEKPGM